MRGNLEQVDLTISPPGIQMTNGMAVAWLLANFGTTAVDPNADPDHDGASNYAEYIAGTNPNDANSVFKFSKAQFLGGGITQLQWPSATDRFYTVMQANGLNAGFTAIATNLAATPPTNTRLVTNSTTGGPYFWKLNVVYP